MEYRCLLWDFDGTLADTGSDVWNSLTYAARRAGGAIDDLYMRDDANLADPMDEIAARDPLSRGGVSGDI